jgi:uncharacterized protein (TIGR00369 family)
LSPEALAASLNQKITGFDRALGLELRSASTERVEADLVVRPEHLQLNGLVHGGVYTAIVETLGSVGAWLSVGGEECPVVGIDNHTSFVRSVRQGTLHAVAEPVHCGRRTLLWEVQIYDDLEKLVATGRLLAMCLDPASQKRVDSRTESHNSRG